MRLKARSGSSGFTLIEVAVALGILGIITLVIAALLIRAVDTYGQVMVETDTTKHARHCLGMISREMRESVDTLNSIFQPAAGAPLGPVQDALLLTSARDSNGIFTLDPNSFPVPESIILFYLNTTPEGITQLVRHQLYYVEDLNAFTPPFVLKVAPSPYVGTNIVVVDNAGAGAEISIDRTTGSVVGTPPLKSPRVLMNRAMSFDIVNNGVDPVEARLICQSIDRYGRTATSRLSTQIEPRNL
jgi:prepilin-type N-terminal cleavage/methylation domain-containing protein